MTALAAAQKQPCHICSSAIHVSVTCTSLAHMCILYLAVVSSVPDKHNENTLVVHLLYIITMVYTASSHSHQSC
jgi:hypothetical protein